MAIGFKRVLKPAQEHEKESKGKRERKKRIAIWRSSQTSHCGTVMKSDCLGYQPAPVP